MDFILLAFVLLILLGCKFQKPKEQFDDYLGLDSTKGLRGIMAIAIILHHMSEKVNTGFVFPQLVHLGYMIVAVFFFLSGYGLFYQYKRRGERYLKGFWKSRIFSLVLIYLFYIIIYSIIKQLVYHNLTIKSILTSLVNGEPIVNNSWYIIVQIILYIIFWISFKIKTSNVNYNILIVFVLQIVLLIVFKSAGYSSIWYMSNFAFAFGMLWANYKEEIDNFLSKRYLLSAFISFAIFTAFSGLPLVIEHFDIVIPYVGLISRIISTTAFVAIVMIIIRIIKPSKKIWQIAGSMSLEIFLIHGLVYTVLSNWMNNSILWTILTIIISITVAFPLSKVDEQIIRRLK